MEEDGNYCIAETTGCYRRSKSDLTAAAADILTTYLLLGDGGLEVNPFGALIVADPVMAVAFKLCGLLTMNAIVVAFNTFERGSRWASYCPWIFVAVSSCAVGWNQGQIMAEAGVIAA